MKKSLIALAVLAAFGTAYAQSTATISGKFGVAVGKALGSDANVHITDGNVTVAAVEDLGGGMKAGVSIDMRTRGREQNVVTASGQEIGRDATVYVSGGFGTVALGSVELGNGIMGLGLGGAQQSLASGWDGAILSGPAYANLLQYTSPSISGFNVSLVHVDSVGTVGVAVTKAAAAAGAPITVNTDTGVSAQQIGATYNQGPISASADYAVFGNKTGTSTTANRTRTRASAAYDMGVIKIGVGIEDNKGLVYQSTTSTTVSTNATYNGNQMIIGASLPVGPLLLGAGYARNSENGALVGDTSNGDEIAKGWLVSANYSLSKRTTLLGTYSDIKRSGGAYYASGTGVSGTTAAVNTTAHTTNSGSQFRIRLMHSF